MIVEIRTSKTSKKHFITNTVDEAVIAFLGHGVTYSLIDLKEGYFRLVLEPSDGFQLNHFILRTYEQFGRENLATERNDR